MELEVEITPLEKFEVKLNGKLIGEFIKTSTWEGFVKLQGENGTIIVSDEQTWVDKMFEGIMQTEPKPKFSVIKISPSLITPTS